MATAHTSLTSEEILRIRLQKNRFIGKKVEVLKSGKQKLDWNNNRKRRKLFRYLMKVHWKKTAQIIWIWIKLIKDYRTLLDTTNHFRQLKLVKFQVQVRRVSKGKGPKSHPCSFIRYWNWLIPINYVFVEDLDIICPQYLS